MGIWTFYILALIPVLIGGILWIFHRENIIEWALGSVIGFILAAIFQIIALHSMTGDVETWSGSISKVSHCPEWVERWEEQHTMRIGKTTTTYYTTEYDTHTEHWTADRNFGEYSDTVNISKSFFDKAERKFGDKIVKDGTQEDDHGGNLDEGDDSIYSAYDNTSYIYPATVTRTFQNKIKAAPTVFSFATVPANIQIYAWPANPDWMHSQRLLGNAANSVNLNEFDKMNSRLGPTKKVNVILIGFGDKDASYADWQRAAWIGGKKNDLVLCYGNSGNRTTWSRVFGWSDSEICKRNLESILLQNKVDTKILPLIETEIAKGYTIKNWSEFDYVTVEPPTWSYVVFVITLVVTQVIFYFIARQVDDHNEYY